MAATFDLKWEVSGSAGGNRIEAGSFYAPAQYSTSSDLMFSRRVPVTVSTINEVFVLSGDNGEPASVTFLALVPNVAGNFWWSGAAAADNGTGIGWRAGVPLVFPTGKILPYNANSATRAAGTAENLTEVYFYPTSDSGYVEVFGLL